LLLHQDVDGRDKSGHHPHTRRRVTAITIDEVNRTYHGRRDVLRFQVSPAVVIALDGYLI
jgi:hypothetical protein